MSTAFLLQMIHLDLQNEQCTNFPATCWAKKKAHREKGMSKISPRRKGKKQKNRWSLRFTYCQLISVIWEGPPRLSACPGIGPCKTFKEAPYICFKLWRDISPWNLREMMIRYWMLWRISKKRIHQNHWVFFEMPGWNCCFCCCCILSPPFY